MVEEQLIRRGISSKKILDAFLKVERHKFLPKELEGDAYGDYPLPIGLGQTISQPYMVALMTEQLDLKGNEKVLEIGTGSGYQTAILAELVKEIYSVERIGSLANNSEKLLLELGYKNIKIKTADGTLGWSEFSPYDRIIVTASSPRIPKSLLDELNEGGKMIIPIGEAFGQVLTLIEKADGKIYSREICGCVFVPLLGKEGWGI